MSFMVKKVRMDFARNMARKLMVFFFQKCKWLSFLYCRLAGGFVPSKYKAYYKQFASGKDCQKIKCGTFA